ncbi:MAG: protein kinase [Polyangiales bacterium]
MSAARAEARRAPEHATTLLSALPIRQISSGPDGVAMLARFQESGALATLRHASVATSDPPRWQSIREAAEVYALIDHPGFRRLLRTDDIDSAPVLTFEGFIERTLDSRLVHRQLEADEAEVLLGQLAPPLAAAHRLGFVHGHLMPSHVLLCDDGTPLLDFGWLDVGHKPSRFDVACRVPEAGKEPLDARSDVYALGALLRLALTGAADGPLTTLPEPWPERLRHWLQVERDARPSMLDICSSLARTEGHPAAHPPSAPRPAPLPIANDFGSFASFASELPPPRPAPRRLSQGVRVGRFEIEVKIGAGGMGEVYRAIDRASGQRAALKVLRAVPDAKPALWQRFRKEARILSQIRSPYIANLIEANTDGAVEFIALEYIDGFNLQQLLDARGRCSERDALQVIADVARGLADAHLLGIVHRDIKPDNILLTEPPGQRREAVYGDVRTADLGVLQVKLCDFGIARSLAQRDGTLGFTEHGAIVGTPAFMAPEQCSGEEINPASDVYSLGVTLFLMLTGRLPFEVAEPNLLFFAHATQTPVLVAQLNPEVSQPTSELVARMLAKAPADRFVDASALLEELERMASGEARSVDVHPVLPAAPAGKLVRHVFEWQLQSNARALWPFVSNTDRLNRAVGLPPAEFARAVVADGVETTARNRVAGVDLHWQERAFEWIEGQRWSVLRVFDGGMMHWYVVELSLRDEPGGGCTLRYAMTCQPRHVIGRLVVAFVMAVEQRRALGRTFARIDRVAQADSENTPLIDAFEQPAPLGAAQRAALDRALAKLQADGVDSQLLDALATFCTQAADQQIASLRPLQFANERGLPPDRVVDACLRAAQHGLFVLLWQVLCPLCRIPTDFAESLRAVEDHALCPSCNLQFAVDFASSLELIFRVSPTIRESELRTYCIGGPAHAPHVVAQLRLAPNERLQVDLTLEAGAYKIRSPQLPYDFQLQVSEAARSSRGRAIFGADPARPRSRVLITPRAQSLELANRLAREIVVRIERSAPRSDALTAARAACLASFRELFPGEVMAPGRLAAVGRTAFLVAQVRDQRALLRAHGDARTFERVAPHLAQLSEHVAAEGGALVKTTSGTSLCAFDSPVAAVRAALAVWLGRQNDATLDVRLLVHQGSAVTATVDGRLDYFGETVEAALELVNGAPAAQILLTRAAAEDVRVIDEVTAAGHSLRPLEASASAAQGLVIAAPSSR